MSTSIVLATEDPDLREWFAVVLAEAGDIDIVESVSSIERVAEALTATDADVLVLDAALTDGRMAETVLDITRESPFVGIVVVTEDASAEAYTAALESGARSTVSMPISLEELRGRLELAAQWARTLRSHLNGQGVRGVERGRLVAVMGAKGGTGTTVLASLIAVEALLPGRSVCLVDFDLRNGNVAFYADVVGRRSVVDLVEVARDLSGRAVREVAVDGRSGVTLILAPEDVERADDMTGEAARLILAQLRSHFDVVVVDCGSRLDDPTAMVLEMADEVVLVATTDVVALRGARKALAAWERLSVRSPSEVKLVLNRVSRRVEVQPDLARRVVGIPVVAEVPAAFKDLEGPLNAGRLFVSRPPSITRVVQHLLITLGLRDKDASAPPAGPRQRRRGRRTRAGLPDGGQVAVEAPVVVAIVVALTLLCLQMVVWGASHVFARHAALEGARVAATTTDPRSIDAAVDGALPAGWARTAPVTLTPGDTVQVTVSTPSLLPGFDELDVTSRAAVLREPS